MPDNCIYFAKLNSAIMRILTKVLVLTLLAAIIGVTPSSAKSKNEKEMKTIHLTKAEFLEKVFNYEANPEVLKYEGDKPALIDFYASWCGPCKALSPILEDLAAQYDGQIYIYKVNTEDERELAQAFNIRSIPTLLFVPMEGKPSMSQGAMPKAELIKAIDELLLEK